MRLFRHMVHAVLMIAGLAAVALAGLADAFTPDRIAEKVRAGISDAFGRPVYARSHSVDFSLSRITLVMRDVTMARSSGVPSPALIASDAIEVTLDPWPLLFGGVRVERVHLSSPRLIAHGDLQNLAAWHPFVASGAPELSVSDGSGQIGVALGGETLLVAFESASGVWRSGRPIELAASGMIAAGLPFVFDGTLSPDRQGQRFDARELRVGKSVFSGSWTVEPRCDRPRISAGLVTERLHADELIGGLSLPALPEPASAFAGGSGIDLAVFDSLDAIDIVLDLRAERALLAGHVFHDAGLAVTLANGRFEITDLHARTGDGAVSLAAVVDRPRASHDFSLRAESLALSSFSNGGATALLDVDLSLTGQGRDWATVLASLSGRARFDLANADTGVPRTDLFDVVLPWVRESGHFTIDRLVADLAIETGRVTAEDIRLETPRVAMDIQGMVDFREGSLHIEFSPTAKDPDIADLSVPLLISGPLGDPAVLPNPVHPTAVQ